MRPAADHRRIGLFAVAGLLTATFALLVPLPFDSRLGQAIGDLAHAPLFGCLTFASLWLLERVSPTASFSKWIVRLVSVGLAWVLIGIAMERLQASTGRTASLHDVVANSLGILAATLLFAAWMLKPGSSARNRSRRVLLALSVACLLAAWWSPLVMLRDVIAVSQEFPLLGSFERPIELQRWYFDDCSGAISDRGVTAGKSSMRIDFRIHPHPAATMIDVYPDWSKVETLHVDLMLAESDASDLEVLVKVIDRHHTDYHHDVFRHSVKLSPGVADHVVIPRDSMINGPDSRDLDLTQIRFVSILAVAPESPATVFVDNIHLIEVSSQGSQPSESGL